MPDTSGSAGVPPVPEVGREWHSRRYLPHFDQPGLMQMISFRLADALPAEAVARITTNAKTTSEQRTGIEAMLDAGLGSCLLGDPQIARMIVNALLRFDGERYRLIAWVVMPNHVHVIIDTVVGHPLSSIVHSWKSFTAKAANQMLGRVGEFWQPEYYDRAIRNERHLATAIRYVHDNPCKAGLASRPGEWLFNSAGYAGPTSWTGETPALPDARQSTLRRTRS